MLFRSKETYCGTENITPEVVIKNTGSINLTTATVSYTLNGGSPVTQNWSGSLVTGATATVIFPQISIPIGDHTFIASVSNPNGTTDVNPANDSLTQNVEVLSFSIPFFEDFETNSFDCWSLEFVSGSTQWGRRNGGMNGYPTSAYSGSNNAFFYAGNTSKPISKLVTPILNMSGVTDATLTFYHAMTIWQTDIDKLEVFYKNSPSGNWNLLQTYTTNTPAWTLRTIALPNVTATYWVAFQGTSNYGYGVCIDDVLIDGDNTGVNDELSTAGIILHPNPTKDNFTLSFAKSDHDYNLISIHDITGKTIYKQTIYSGTTSLKVDCSSFASGVYVVTMHSEHGNAIKKLVIE